MSAFVRQWVKATIVLFVLALLSFGCAYRGWTVQGVRHADAFFLSFEALKLGSEYRISNGWAGNLWLEAARLFGLAFYLLTLIKAFGLLLRSQVEELQAQVSGRDLVCVGDHPILGNIARTTALHGRKTLWLGAGGKVPLPRRARQVARPWDRTMIGQFRLKRARTCVVAFDDDMAALDATLQLAPVFDRPLIMLPSGSDTADAVRALQSRADVRTVPVAQPIVRTLHERHLPFLAPRAAGQSALDVLIVGGGGMAEAVMSDLLLSSLTSFLSRPRITFLAPDAARMAAEFAVRFPELPRSVDLRFIDGTDGRDRRDGRDIVTALTGWEAMVTNAYVCLDDDRRSLAAGGALDRLAAERGWPVETIFFHQRGGGAVWHETPRGEARHDRLVPFGASDDLAWSLGLLDPHYDAAARHLHDAYRGFASSDLARQPWEDLSEDTREANRRHAMHLPAKLASAGVSLDAWVSRRNAGVAAPPLPPFPDLNADPALLDRLARLEHERWMVERRLNGWRYDAVRDNDRRRHPDLVPFDDLSQRSKDYDTGMLRALAASSIGSSQPTSPAGGRPR